MESVVIITGASSGIGLELAKLFAKDGRHTILVARSESRLAGLQTELVKEFNSKVDVLPLDLARQENAQQVYDYCRKRDYAVSCLVNNAGFGDYGLFAERSWDKYEEMINLNVLTLTRLTHLFLPDMIARGMGRILNVASVAGLQPDPRFAVYGASKAFVISLSEALHKELEGTGVTCTVLSPGVTRTNFMDRAEMGKAKIYKSGVMDAAEVARVGYRAMIKGNLHVIPGLKNKVLGFLSSITPPGRLRLSIAAKVMEPEQ